MTRDVIEHLVSKNKVRADALTASLLAEFRDRRYGDKIYNREEDPSFMLQFLTDPDISAGESSSDFPDTVFSAAISSIKVCSCCGIHSQSENAIFTALQLSLHSLSGGTLLSDITDVIMEFTAKESVEVYCNICQSNRLHEKWTVVSKLPRVIVLELKRHLAATADMPSTEKQPVLLSEFIDVRSLTLASGDQTDIEADLENPAELIAVVMYFQLHYTVAVKRHGHWYYINDDITIAPIEFSELNVYQRGRPKYGYPKLLFYEKTTHGPVGLKSRKGSSAPYSYSYIVLFQNKISFNL
jgi:hypothetical protein